MSIEVQSKETVIKNKYKYTKEDIKEMICKYDGELVLFDFCLAKMFNYSLKHINQNVKNNYNKYQDDICTIGLEEAKEIIKNSMTINGVSLTETDFSLTENLLSMTYEIKLNSRYKPKLFTKNAVKLLAESLKKNEVNKNLPIILEAFDDIETADNVELKMRENTVNINVFDKIHTIRGEQVILDYDLAELYGYDVKRLNEQVSRNRDRFPDDFMFQLNFNEASICSRSQIATLNESRGSNLKYAPYAFTEQGVYMLSTVLRSKIAVQQSILIMRAFRSMRHYIAEHQQIIPSIDFNQLLIQRDKMNELDKKIEDIDEKLDYSLIDVHKKLSQTMEENLIVKQNMQIIMSVFEGKETPKSFTFYNNQLFEADEVYKEIFSQADKSIYIIDNYISIKTLSHLTCKKDKVNVVLFSDNLGGRDKLRKIEFDDFAKQYPSLSLKHNGISHDRYIIIDYNTENEKIYHSGASIKDAGKKLCTIMQMNDAHIMHFMIDKLLSHDDYHL